MIAERICRDRLSEEFTAEWLWETPNLFDLRCDVKIAGVPFTRVEFNEDLPDCFLGALFMAIPVQMEV